MGGIKGLQTFLKKTQNCVNRHKHLPLDINCIAIDAYNSLWKYLYSNTEEPLYCIFNQATTLLSIGIKPIYILDGKPFDDKNFILEKRKIKKINKLIKKEKQLSKLIEINKNHPELKLESFIESLKRSTRTMTPDLIKNFKKLLNIINVQFIESEYEADYTIAKMYKLGLIDGCITDDMDLHLLGCHRVFTFEKNTIKSVIEYNHIYNNINLSKEQYSDLCLLLGTDYHKKKIKLSLELIFHNITKYENIQEWVINETDNTVIEYLKESIIIKNYLEKIIAKIEINMPEYKDKNINIKELQLFFNNIVNNNHKKYHFYDKFIKIIDSINFNKFIKFMI